MRFEDIISGPLPLQAGLWIGRHMPSPVGYGVARLFADGIALGKPHVYSTVRRNLRQIVGPAAPDRQIRRLAWQVFYHTGQAHYDLFRALGRPPATFAQSVQVSEAFLDLVRAEIKAGRGVLLLGIHMGCFDLGLLTLADLGVPALILSLSEEQVRSNPMNEVRVRQKLEIMALGPQALRAAIERLQSGGVVITGADRPAPGERDMVSFFGRPAYLPLGPARLALMTGATVMLGTTYRGPAQGYVFDYTGPIEMARTGSRRDDILASTRRLAEAMEAHIRPRPAQWLMFHPMWPGEAGPAA